MEKNEQNTNKQLDGGMSKGSQTTCAGLGNNIDRIIRACLLNCQETRSVFPVLLHLAVLLGSSLCGLQCRWEHCSVVLSGADRRKEYVPVFEVKGMVGCSPPAPLLCAWCITLYLLEALARPMLRGLSSSRRRAVVIVHRTDIRCSLYCVAPVALR